MKKPYFIVILLMIMQSVLAQSKDDLPTISTKTQGMEKHNGYFTFYWDDKTGSVFLEVDKLDQEFLYVNSLPTGIGSNDLGLDRGKIGDSRIVKFIKSGPKILLVQPNYAYRAVSDNPDERRATEQAFAQSIIWGFKSAAQEGDRVLIDLTPFLLRDSFGVADSLSNLGQGNYKFEDSRSAIYLSNTKSFPKNTEFESIITLIGSANAAEIKSVTPDAGAITVHMHQSFIELPDNNYKPRKFDPRAGYFYVSYMDFATPIDQPVVKRFITRHRLQKKDPNAAMSDPVEPIVYYVDRGAPEPVRTALMEGASWWNQAFEAAGYKNAFQVKLLPDTIDPMDIRYNIIQWVHRSTRGWSYGESIVDPRTGEIIKGQVSLGSLRDRQDFLIAEGLLQPYEDGKPISGKMLQMAVDRLHQLAVHEVGHTLGLYHNFTSSTQNRASVMDYPPPTITVNADGSINITNAYTKEIGGWDKRAILYGYQDFPKGADEDAELKKITQETLKQGYSFMADGDSRPSGSAHPLAHLWDSGNNPADELNRLMVIRKQIIANFSEKAIRQDAPMATLEDALVPMYLIHRYQTEAASKMIGGLYYTYALKNDGQLITRMVPANEQWKAFNALVGTLSPDALALPEQLIAEIPPRPIGYPRTREDFKSRTGLTFDPMGAAESAADATLQFMLQPERAARLVEFHARDSQQPGLIAVLDKLITSTWKAPIQNGDKGELQNMVNSLVLAHLLSLADDPTAAESVRGIALLEVSNLKSWMTSQTTKANSIQRANLLFGLQQIGLFEKDPDKFKPHKPLNMPDGSPIGLNDFD